jgi:hypothetical protein
MAIRFASEPTEPKTRRPELEMDQRLYLPEEGGSDGSTLKTKLYPNQPPESVLMSNGSHYRVAKVA